MTVLEPCPFCGSTLKEEHDKEPDESMKDRTLVTEFGTLVLPRWVCLSCISSRRFMSCTSCEFMNEMSHEAKIKFDEVWANITGGGQ